MARHEQGNRNAIFGLQPSRTLEHIAGKVAIVGMGFMDCISNLSPDFRLQDSPPTSKAQLDKLPGPQNPPEPGAWATRSGVQYEGRQFFAWCFAAHFFRTCHASHGTKRVEEVSFCNSRPEPILTRGTGGFKLESVQ